jgi:DNA polymerase/3'-5' exonuclease PolX
MHLYNAKIIALDIYEKLKPFCEKGKIKIAGSIRRQAAREIKDIEIVCLPNISLVENKNLFGEVISSNIEVCTNYQAAVKNLGSIDKGKFGGKYMKVMHKQIIDSIQHEISIDIFTPRAEDYYRQLAIRTGSSDFAHKKIAAAWVKKGWIGIDGFLYKKKQCFTIDSKVWYPKKDVYLFDKPPVWKSELEFFEWLGIQYLEPFERNL